MSSTATTAAPARAIRSGPGRPNRARCLAPAVARSIEGGSGRRASIAAARPRSGPRPASHPARTSAAIASPGTYQVQSISECAPNTITTQAIVSRPTRSEPYARPSPRSSARQAGRAPRRSSRHERQRRLNGCVARPAAAAQVEQQRERQQEPDDAEVGERLHDEAVRVFDRQGTGAVAQPRDFVAVRADAERRGAP